jgi:TetR/AcrR family transcriptional regulator, transcriptional repressor of bet genes
MPRRADHDERRHQITDAVCRITAKGGLASATFREVAAEAGVSVRLVQYYFGTKDQLLLVTQQHVAERATKRILARVAKARDEPRAVLREILTSFVPDDDESRENMLMFVALHTTALVDPTLARDEARMVPDALRTTVERQLRRARLRKGVDPKREAQILVSVVPSQAQAVLDGSQTARGAVRVIQYAIDRALP